MSDQPDDAATRHAKWFFLAVVAAASVATPISYLWVAVAGDGRARAAAITGLCSAAVLSAVLVLVARKMKTPELRGFSWALSLGTTATALVAPTVPFGSAASIGFGAFVGAFLTGFAVLLARQKLR